MSWIEVKEPGGQDVAGRLVTQEEAMRFPSRGMRRIEEEESLRGRREVLELWNTGLEIHLSGEI